MEIVNITKEEFPTVNFLDRIKDQLLVSLRAFTGSDPRFDKIMSRPKMEGENKGQWGYYISYETAYLTLFLAKIKAKSLLDLGSGAGILLAVAKIFNPSLRIMGYEIEDVLIETANKMHIETKEKDILKLKKVDIKNYEVIFFYEPFADHLLAHQFITNLAKRVIKGQLIVYHPAGLNTLDYMCSRKDKFQYVQRLGGLEIYEVL